MSCRNGLPGIDGRRRRAFRRLGRLRAAPANPVGKRKRERPAGGATGPRERARPHLVRSGRMVKGLPLTRPPRRASASRRYRPARPPPPSRNRTWSFCFFFVAPLPGGAEGGRRLSERETALEMAWASRWLQSMIARGAAQADGSSRCLREEQRKPILQSMIARAGAAAAAAAAAEEKAWWLQLIAQRDVAGGRAHEGHGPRSSYLSRTSSATPDLPRTVSPVGAARRRLFLSLSLSLSLAIAMRPWPMAGLERVCCKIVRLSSELAGSFWRARLSPPLSSLARALSDSLSPTDGGSPSHSRTGFLRRRVRHLLS
ncbi:hypothetical protein CDD83_9918 [Cordyceps sp. RAO-2017]|nr:hypothetical protein CDD83_9918 [Cordyceps sp. RAO-2017]